MGLLLATLQAFAIMMAISFGLLLITMSLTIFWIRRKVVGRVYAYFIEPNRQITRELLTIEDASLVRSRDGGDYLLAASKTMWSKWPPGLPNWAQEIVPTLLFIRNNADPYDPTVARTQISSRSVRAITDEKMLMATWRDAHDAAEEGTLLGRRWTTWVLVVNLFLTLGLAFGLWVVFRGQTQGTEYTRELLNLVKGL